MTQIYQDAMDKGLEGVVACSTKISSIVDSTLCYQGYSIEDLAAHANFEEVIYLLWNGEQPSAQNVKDYKEQINTHLNLNDKKFVALLQALPTQVHPMTWLRSAVSLLSHWDSNESHVNPNTHKTIGFNLVAKLPLLVAFFHNLREGKVKNIPSPQSEKGIAWNFLYLLNGKEPSITAVKVFDTCLVLHADHELNCSAFSTRVIASSLSDIYSAVIGGIGALKGPLHGGANEQVMRMLKKIDSVENTQEWIQKALKNKEKIMGFGHRVYKNGDPRAQILKGMSAQLCQEASLSKFYKMSEIIDNTVKSEKGLLPNVDFYSATVYYSMGIPMDLYTPIFACSRISGWLAHIFEQYSNNRIYRPRGQWAGQKNRKWDKLITKT